MPAAIDTNYAPAFTNASATVNPGDCVAVVGGIAYLATDAFMAANPTAHCDGVVLIGGITCLFQASGRIDASVSGLGAGTKSLVKRNSAGRLSRAAFDTVSEFIGECDGSGNVTFGRISSTTTLPLTSITVTGGDLDPAQFGAVGDGFHDDLPAFVAMLASIPATGTTGVRIKLRPVTYYFSDSLYCNRDVRWQGNAGGNPKFSGTTFAFPAGRGMFLDNNPVNLARGGDGGYSGSDWAHVVAINFKTCPLAHWTTWGTNAPQACGGFSPGVAGGYVGNGERGDAIAYPLGAVLARGAASNAVCFGRCTVPGTTAGTVPGATTNEPAGWASSVAGTVIVDGTATFVLEKFPQDYVAGNTYAVGDRIFIPGVTTHYFECVQAGTSSLAASDAKFQLPVYFAGSSTAQETFSDGSLKWIAKTHSALIVTSGQVRIQDCLFTGFTTAAIMFLSTTGSSPQALTDFSVVDRCFSYLCGMGVLLTGFDSNGIRVSDFFAYYSATGRSNVDTTTFGPGGYLIWDRGLRNSFYGCYGQSRVNPATSSGPAYRADASSTSGFFNCDSEQSMGDVFKGTNTVFRQSFSGINWAASSAFVKLIDYQTQNTFQFEGQSSTTTSSVQAIYTVPQVGAGPATCLRYEVTVTGKRNGNHSSYVQATCVAFRGTNNSGAQEQGTDTWTVAHWGSEDAFNALPQTFDFLIAGGTNQIRGLNLPAYQVDWSVTVKISGRVV